MQSAAEERLAQLRDTYGPGWMEREHSETNNTSSNSLLQQLPSRTREYLRRVEATRSEALLQSSSTRCHTGRKNSSDRILHRNSKLDGDDEAGSSSSRQMHDPSTGSIDIDLPAFTQPDNVV